MRRFHWAMALPFALVCFSGADSIPTFNIFQVTYGFITNQGGDNAGYSLVGAGINLSGGGSANCLPSEFCNGGVPLSPGTSVVPDISIDFESSQGTLKIGGQTFGGGEVLLFGSSITAPNFILPLGGSIPSVFTITLPASFGLIHGTAGNGTLFNVNVPPGELVLTFDYFPATNGNPASYFFVNGKYLVPTPEPGTLALMATGLAGILKIVRKKP